MLFLAKIFMYLITIGVICIVFMQTQDMPLAASIYPTVVAIIVTLLLIIEIIRLLPSKAKSNPSNIGADIELSSEEQSDSGLRKAILVFGAIFLLISGLYLLGFYLTIPIFIFGYMTLEKEKLYWALLYASVVGALNWYVFGNLLNLPFPIGILWE